MPVFRLSSLFPDISLSMLMLLLRHREVSIVEQAEERRKISILPKKEKKSCFFQHYWSRNVHLHQLTAKKSEFKKKSKSEEKKNFKKIFWHSFTSNVWACLLFNWKEIKIILCSFTLSAQLSDFKFVFRQMWSFLYDCLQKKPLNESYFLIIMTFLKFGFNQKWKLMNLKMQTIMELRWVIFHGVKKGKSYFYIN